jgi:hypothetical protein
LTEAKARERKEAKLVIPFFWPSNLPPVLSLARFYQKAADI